MSESRSRSGMGRAFVGLAIVATAIAVAFFVARSDNPISEATLKYQPRKGGGDTGGYQSITSQLQPWTSDTPMEEIIAIWKSVGPNFRGQLDEQVADPAISNETRLIALLTRASIHNFEGHSGLAAADLATARALVEADRPMAERWLYTIIYFQGVTALRRGEDENCILCRGESSCILPISAAAVHTNKAGSGLAVEYFSEYLTQFPDDLEVKWLLNVAHMTLGQHPQGIEPRHLLSLDRFWKSEFDIGRFRDIGHIVGVNRLNNAGGGVMDDFDNDGLLDLVVTSNVPGLPMGFYRNKGDGTFEERAKEAGLSRQFSGLFCVQADYNNDGHLDLFIPRGAWTPFPMRASLLRNNGNGTFTDVTKEAGLEAGMNSLSACWADFDNDGFLDLFVPCGPQPSRLYRNKGDGTFEDVAQKAGVAGTDAQPGMWKSATWIDFDRDGYPDLFVNRMRDTAILYRNNRDGTFTDVTAAMGIDGPRIGFACWAWDYDNDGWPDIFATCYEYPLEDVVLGLLGKPHKSQSNRLYRNLGGKGFQDVTKEAGLDAVFATMGSNFGDFDNDGFLDMYLGTGGPDLATLIPNRMFKNVAGKRFADISASSGTGHLQKGHSVACGDWDRNGTLDIFIEMGGAIPGDQYHNILFQNPGQGNNWLNVKLVGKKSNRSAIGARIKVVTAGPDPLTIHREVSTGGSFGANPLEQLVGVGKAERIAELEVYWPTSGTTQTFHNVPVNQAIEIAEFAAVYRKRDYKPIPLPK